MVTGDADFIGTIERRASLPRDEAERAAHATLATLAERISPGEARELAERLPEELRADLEREARALPLSAEDFVWGVHKREQVPAGMG